MGLEGSLPCSQEPCISNVPQTVQNIQQNISLSAIIA